MAEQLLLDLPFRTAMGRADFFVSDANTAAVAAIDGWRDWPFGKLLLTGPQGSGKTHLVHVWAAQSAAEVVPARALDEARLEVLSQADAVAVEDAETIAGDRARETRLFHLHNALAERGAPLLVTASSPPSRWGLVLPDLESRMAQARLEGLLPPDDRLLAALMVKLATDRQVRLTPRLIAYAIPRMERSFAAVQTLMANLDAVSLKEKEPIREKHLRALLARD